MSNTLLSTASNLWKLVESYILMVIGFLFVLDVIKVRAFLPNLCVYLSTRNHFFVVC